MQSLFDTIGNAIRKPGEEPVYLDIDEVCGRSRRPFDEGLLKACEKCPGKCYVNEAGVARFVSRRIGRGLVRRTGEYFYLGEVSGRTLYFGTNPDRSFYAAHKGKVSIVIGRNGPDVPENWAGDTAILSELFYTHEDGETFKCTPGILAGIIPACRTPRLICPRRIHARRDLWLVFLADLLSRPYVSSDFIKGCIRPEVVCDWFVARYGDKVPQNRKSYQRDLHAFCNKPKDANETDQYEAIIVRLLEKAADSSLSARKRHELGERIVQCLASLRESAKEAGHAVEFTRGVWQHCGGNSEESAYTAVTDDDGVSDLCFDKMGARKRPPSDGGSAASGENMI